MASDKRREHASPFFKFKDWFFCNPHNLTGTEIKTLLVLCTLMSWHTNLILLEPDVEDSVTERLGMRKDYFRRVVSRLEKKGLLRKSGWAYEINPKFAEKGEYYGDWS